MARRNKNVPVVPTPLTTPLNVDEIFVTQPDGLKVALPIYLRYCEERVRVAEDRCRRAEALIDRFLLLRPVEGLPVDGAVSQDALRLPEDGVVRPDALPPSESA